MVTHFLEEEVVRINYSLPDGRMSRCALQGSRLACTMLGASKVTAESLPDGKLLWSGIVDDLPLQLYRFGELSTMTYVY